MEPPKTALTAGEQILFIGDSITDCGRREPAHRPLGCGYVRFFHDLQITREPEKTVHICNRGIGGNTVIDLRNRWSDDCLLLYPDWVTIKIGINDCNRFLSNPDFSWFTPEKYGEIYSGLLEETRKSIPECRILLVTPFYMSRDDHPDSYRRKVLNILPEYIAIIAGLSERFGTRFLNLHEAFERLLRHRNTGLLGSEPVHPDAIGHLFIAEQVYQALAEE